MADRKLTAIDIGSPATPATFHTSKTATGETRTGSTKDGAQGGLYVQTGNAAARTLNDGTVIPAQCENLGSWFALDGVDASGVAKTYYFFVTTAGVLRVSDTVPTNTNSDGSAV